MAATAVLASALGGRGDDREADRAKLLLGTRNVARVTEERQDLTEKYKGQLWIFGAQGD